MNNRVYSFVIFNPVSSLHMGERIILV